MHVPQSDPAAHLSEIFCNESAPARIFWIKLRSVTDLHRHAYIIHPFPNDYELTENENHCQLEGVRFTNRTPGRVPCRDCLYGDKLGRDQIMIYMTKIIN